MGASLLVFLNKTDVEGCMTEDEVRRVSYFFSFIFFLLVFFFFFFFFSFDNFCTFRDPRTILIHAQRLELDAIKTHRWTILPCSAMAGKNLNEGLEWVVQDAKDRLFLY
jgi:ADP-ribosylation factor-like protein 2